MISVKLYSTLRRYCPGSDIDVPICVEFESGITIGMLMAKLGIVEDKEVMLVAVNDEVKGQDYDYVVQDGDRVSLFGLLAGG